MSNLTLGGVICLCLLFVAQTAADEPVFSGPQPGEMLARLNVVLAYGAKQGEQVDLVAAADGRPSLLVFVRGANRPAARLTRVLMNYAEMRAGRRVVRRAGLAR